MKIKYWTYKEDQFLKQNYKTMTVDEMAEKLNRSKNAIYQRLRKNDLKIGRRKNVYEIIKNHEVIAVGTADECAATLGVSPITVRGYASPARWSTHKNLDNATTAIKVEDEDDE